MKKRFTAFLLCVLLLLTGCANNGNPESKETEKQGEAADLGGDEKTFGDSLDDLGAYDGYFEGESANIAIECISGTKNAYQMEGNTLTFTAAADETVYAVSGTFKGNIVIDVGDGVKFTLELH